MAESTVWWMLAGAAVAVELVTGTFYLLMLGVGAMAAALAAHAGVPLAGQILTSALFGGGAVAAWHWKSSKRPHAVPANANPDLHIDIGRAVHVHHWNADSTATVKYRGANWTAVLAEPALSPPGAGQFRIKELVGNQLVVDKAP